MKPEWVIIAIVAAAPVPVLAQQAPEPPATDPPPNVEQVMARGRELYRAPGAPKPCKPAQGNEIVVCRRSQDSYRTDSTLDDALRDGRRTAGAVPDAPDVDGLPKGQTVVGRGCFVPPCPPPPAYMIDFGSLPDALTPEQAEKVRAAPGPAPGP